MRNARLHQEKDYAEGREKAGRFVLATVLVADLVVVAGLFCPEGF